MKKQHLLKSMLLLCALVAGSGSVWAVDIKTTDYAWPIPSFVEDFESTTVNSSSVKKASVTNYTAMGAFNAVYNNDDSNNSYGIENSVFGSKALFLSEGNTKSIVTAITTESFSSIGAFSCKVKKTNYGMFGLYNETISGNPLTHAKASVMIQVNNGVLKISSGSSWVNIGTYSSTDIIDIMVIYNNTTSATSYGNAVSLGAKRAHVFVNGNCVLNGSNPKEFTIPGAALLAFRAAVNGNPATLNLDDVKIYDKVPAASVGGTISDSGWNTFSSAYDLDLSTITGGTAYVATAASTGKVTLEPTTAKVPAGTGLMIKGDATDDFTISTTTAATSTPAVNKLVGLPSGGKVEKNDNNYVFGWEDPSSPGFYLINSTEPTLAAGKAYLHTDAALSQFLSVDFEEGGATSIEAIESHKAQTSSAYFNLAGQRVAQPTKGLYIVNGKKVIIK